MIKARYGDRLDGWIRAIFPFLFNRKLNPNLLTLLGSLVSGAAALAFATGHFAVGGLLLLGGGFFDLVDGVVARNQGQSTRFGAFLDSTMDRLVDMVVLLGIVMYFAAAGDIGIVLLVGVVLVSTVMTSYAKARAETLVPSLPEGVFERGERIVLLALGGILGFLVPVLWILAIGTTLTVAQRFAAAYREMMILDAAAESGAGEPSRT